MYCKWGFYNTSVSRFLGIEGFPIMCDYKSQADESELAEIACLEVRQYFVKQEEKT